MSFYDKASLLTIPTAYKTSKLYSVKPTDGSGDFTFARSTTGTRVNESGLIEKNIGVNVPRIDYLSGTPALLLEPQRTNLVAQSEYFSSTYWSKQCDIIPNTLTQPDGTQFGFSIKEITSNAYQYIYKSSFNVTVGNQYTFSVFAKYIDLRYIQLSVYDGSNYSSACFDLIDKTSDINTNGSYTASSDKVEDYGNGWLRLSYTFTSPITSPIISICTSNTATAGYIPFYIGSGLSSAIYGSQIEEGAYPTSYIPTSGTSVTRVADEIGLLQFSSYFPNLSKGTIFFEFEDKGHRGTGSSARFIFRNSVGGNQLAFITRPDGFLFYDFNSQNYLITSGTQVGQTYKYAVTFNGKIAVGFANGLKKNTETSVNDFEINEWIFTSFIHNSLSFKNIMFFPTALSDAECIALTTI